MKQFRKPIFWKPWRQQFSPRPVKTVLELGCGGGRQTLEMSKRGYAVTAIDLNPSCVDGRSGDFSAAGCRPTFCAETWPTSGFRDRVDLAHCLVNTFRHLTSEQAARNICNVLLPH